MVNIEFAAVDSQEEEVDDVAAGIEVEVVVGGADVAADVAAVAVDNAAAVVEMAKNVAIGVLLCIS